MIGNVPFHLMREAIFDFFENKSNGPEDTLLFYFSGHGIPDAYGDVFLSSSEIDPDRPHLRGFSFEDLTQAMNRSISMRIITILDCCYSGAAKISKGDSEESVVNLGRSAMSNKLNMVKEGEGRYILAASQATQEAYGLEEKGHSIYTYFLLEGLKGNIKSVDAYGNVTPSTLSNYVYKELMNQEKRPKQKPLTKGETSGEIILASYPELVSPHTYSKDGHPLPKSKEISIEEKNKKKIIKIIALLLSGAIIFTIVLIFVFTVTPDTTNIKSNTPTSHMNPEMHVSIEPNAGKANSTLHYNPSTISINNNTKVTWDNNDSVIHTVVSGSPFSLQSDKEKIGQIFDSGIIRPNGTFSYIFDTVGEFDYYCMFHPFTMRAQITVK